MIVQSQPDGAISRPAFTPDDFPHGLRLETLIDVARWRAVEQPDRRIYTFLLDGESEAAHLTYDEIDRQARAIAGVLQRATTPGDRVLLLYPPGLEYMSAFLGCLYAGVIAVPAYPPDPGRLARTLPRLLSIVGDAQASAALTTSAILELGEMLFAHAPELRALHWIASDAVGASEANRWRPPTIGADAVAFLQYTSGSTAAPKGVMITHENLLSNLALFWEKCEFNSESRIAGWLPLYHDMGLVTGVFMPLYGGISSILMSPIHFLQRPFRWLQMLSRYRATFTGGPNFGFDLCVRKTSPDQRATLDLSALRVAGIAAEPVRPETISRFIEAFAPHKLRPEAVTTYFGLAEATLIVTGGRLDTTPAIKVLDAAALERHEVLGRAVVGPGTRAIVGCGTPVHGEKVIVVDQTTLTQCRSGQIGEVWIAGPSVGTGYWNRPEETAEVFCARLADIGEGPFLRTGDLGFVDEAELFITGRCKDLIIISGRNHYPQDIEHTVAHSHPACRIGSGAAFAINRNGREQLVVVQEVNTGEAFDAHSVVRVISAAISEAYGVAATAVVLIRAGGLPKTSSGKIQRHACRAAFLSGALDRVEDS